MKKWEYFSTSHRHRENDPESKTIEELGNDGWELVCIHKGTHDPIYHYKREIEEEEEKLSDPIGGNSYMTKFLKEIEECPDDTQVIFKALGEEKPAEKTVTITLDQLNNAFVGAFRDKNIDWQPINTLVIFCAMAKELGLME